MSSAPASWKAGSLAPPRAVPRGRVLLFVGIACVGCLVDLLSKEWIFQWRGMPHPGNEWWIWEGYFGIQTATNPGALFGLGRGFGIGFALLSVVAATGIVVWLFWFGAGRDRLLTIALGCVMGGIGGNLYDRLGMWQVPGDPGVYCNEVRDWILLRYGSFTWPNFNIADSLLVCGACLLMWHGFRTPPQAGHSQDDTEPVPPAAS